MNYEKTSKVRNMRIPTKLYQQIDDFAVANCLNYTSAMIMLLNNTVNSNLSDEKCVYDNNTKVRNVRIPLKLYQQIEKMAKKRGITFTAMVIISLSIAIKKPKLIMPEKE